MRAGKCRFVVTEEELVAMEVGAVVTEEELVEREEGAVEGLPGVVAA